MYTAIIICTFPLAIAILSSERSDIFVFLFIKMLYNTVMASYV